MPSFQFQGYLSRIGLLGGRPWFSFEEDQYTYVDDDPAPGDSFPHPFLGR